jgi:hypothetical protein
VVLLLGTIGVLAGNDTLVQPFHRNGVESLMVLQGLILFPAVILAAWTNRANNREAYAVVLALATLVFGAAYFVADSSKGNARFAITLSWLRLAAWLWFAACTNYVRPRPRNATSPKAGDVIDLKRLGNDESGSTTAEPAT